MPEATHGFAFHDLLEDEEEEEADIEEPVASAATSCEGASASLVNQKPQSLPAAVSAAMNMHATETDDDLEEP
jgi:hypothetical protein